MLRFGIRWNGPREPIATEMPDGYWTPYHLAKDDIDRLLVALRNLYEAQPYSDQQRYKVAVDEAGKVLLMFSA